MEVLEDTWEIIWGVSRLPLKLIRLFGIVPLGPPAKFQSITSQCPEATLLPPTCVSP